MLEDIGVGDNALLCLTELTACCEPPYTGAAMGNWYFSNGTRVPSEDSMWDFMADCFCNNHSAVCIVYMYHSPVVASMYMVWITPRASGISQR